MGRLAARRGNARFRHDRADGPRSADGPAHPHAFGEARRCRGHGEHYEHRGATERPRFAPPRRYRPLRPPPANERLRGVSDHASSPSPRPPSLRPAGGRSRDTRPHHAQRGARIPAEKPARDARPAHAAGRDAEGRAAEPTTVRIDERQTRGSLKKSSLATTPRRAADASPVAQQASSIRRAREQSSLASRRAASRRIRGALARLGGQPLVLQQLPPTYPFIPTRRPADPVLLGRRGPGRR